MMKNLRTIVSLTAFGAALAACAGQPQAESIGTSQEEIIAGSTSPSSQDAAVLLVHFDGGGSYAACTATLVAPNLVLTARHCVSHAVEEPFYCDADGALVAAGPGGGTVTSDFAADELYVFTGTKRPNLQLGKVQAAAHGKTLFHDDSKVLCGNDLALVVLDHDVAGATIAPIRLDGPIAVGEKLTAVGWGATTSTETPLVRQQRSGIVVRHVGPFGKGSVSAVPANDFSVGESICAGDSGGPAISEETGAVIGVVSRGGNGTNDPDDLAAGCIGASTINHYTQTAPFKDLILSAFESARQEPWVESGIDPRLSKFGVACGSNEDCRSNICSQGTCGQSCATEACPNGFVCQTEGGDKMCRAPENAANPHDSHGCALSSPGEDRPFGALALTGAIGLVLAAMRRRRSR